MTEHVKLQMCPLCCDPTRTNMEVYFHDNAEMVDEYKAGCGSCGCSTPIFKTKNEAALFWNKRVPSSHDNCPMCNDKPEFLEYKVRTEQVEPFYKYKCHCGFEGGISKNKELIQNSWSKNR